MRKIRTFKHSGNLGDIIYALPAIIALGGGILYIATDDYPPRISADAPHPKPMSLDTVMQMTDFLRSQPYLKDVRPYGGEIVDYDLDQFREYVVHDKAGWRVHLACWHLSTFAVRFDLCRTWLHHVKPTYVNDIVVSYSSNNADHSGGLNWNVLEDYLDKSIFVGFENEYSAFKEYTGLDMPFFEAKNITELARVIRGSKLLISNQCFSFALAEGMKRPRVLDVLRLRSNSLPQSCSGHLHLDKEIIHKYLHARWSFLPPRFINRRIAKKMNEDYHINYEGDAIAES